MTFRSALSSFSIGLVLTFTLVGCGKKANNKADGIITTTPVVQTDLDRLLEQQNVACDTSLACPNYLAKIAVVENQKLSFCTGFLVNETTVATSSSCIPDFMKRPDGGCNKDIYFFFPQTANRPAERVGCKKILQVSITEGNNPALWRDDVSFLEIDRSLYYRRQAHISRDGIVNNKEYSAWFVDQVDDYTALIRRDSCEALHDTYVNPFATGESSPNLIFGNCVMNRGSTGAPILDSRGKVRAIVSQSISQKMIDFLNASGLLMEPLKKMLHATNFACAPTITDNEMLDERECSKELSYFKIDLLRKNMLSSTTLFGDLQKKLEDDLEALSKYVRFGIKVSTAGDVQTTEIYPKCFKPYNSWVSGLSGTRNNYVIEVSIPSRSFKRSMSGSARIQGIAIEGQAKDYFLQFSMKSIRSYSQSTVFMWNANENHTFSNLTETCPSVL